MANPERVTVEKGYFDALLRRADFHTAAQVLGRPDPANVTISKVEYESLLRASEEFQQLKNALFQGGLTEETLNLLLSGAPAQRADGRKDSAVDATGSWIPYSSTSPQVDTSIGHQTGSTQFQRVSWRSNGCSSTQGAGNGGLQNGNFQSTQSHLRVPLTHRHTSYGMSSVPEDLAFDDDEDYDESQVMTAQHSQERRTLFFSGLSDRTTYRDLMSVIKGGKVLSVNLRPERTALVSFVDGAAEFLAWTKRNDIYLNAKRIEVKWADRQYRLNTHIGHKIANGATRNILIRNATEKGLTDGQIREDMDHIHGLAIADVTYRGSDAYVSTNSVHNALFARTCMMSRQAYRGCKIEFFRDECDEPLPARAVVHRAPAPAAVKKVPITNRFNMLNIDSGDDRSDQENVTPSSNDSEDEDEDEGPGHHPGVSLRFLDSDSI